MAQSYQSFNSVSCHYNWSKNLIIFSPVHYQTLEFWNPSHLQNYIPHVDQNIENLQVSYFKQGCEKENVENAFYIITSYPAPPTLSLFLIIYL